MKTLAVFGVLYALWLNDALAVSDTGYRHPVIFVPGDGGSQIQGKLNKPSTVHVVCDQKTDDYFTLWFSPELVVPVIVDCLVDNLKLNYDNETRTTYNQPGVQTIVPGFGDPATVEWLGPERLSFEEYFIQIGNALEDLGYLRNKDLFGAPFDFRKAPNELQDYFIQLKNLVEQSSLLNGNKSVILMGHSMGAPMSLYFLQQQTKEWKDRYIKSLMTISGAYAGCMKPIKIYLIGDNLDVFIVPTSSLREVSITMPSIAWLTPSPLFWAQDEVLVETPSKNYSLGNIKDLFEDIDFPVGWEMFQDQSKFKDFSPPDVEVHCIHGTGVDTVEKITYSDTFPDGDYEFTNGDGDGTVNRRSLESCLTWRGKQEADVYHLVVQDASHNGILKHNTTLTYITDYISSLQRT